MLLMPSGHGCASAGAQKTETKRKSIIRVRFIEIASGLNNCFICAFFAPVYITLSLPCGEQKRQNAASVKNWEIIARNLKKRGWSLGYVSIIDSQGRTIWIADAHRRDRKRFVVRADEKLTAFVELESAIQADF